MAICEKASDAPPQALHLVISLAHGGLERLVVDWTNVRNRRHSGSTMICCLDAPGDLADQVADGAVACVQANRSRFPWDSVAVRSILDLLCAPCSLPHAPRIIHAHNLAAWQYGVLAKLYWRRKCLRREDRVNIDEQDGQDEEDWGGTGRRSSITSRKEGMSATSKFVASGLRSEVFSAPLRLVYTQHGANVHNSGFRDRVRARILACFTDEIVAVSEATADVMAKTLWISRRRIKVIANGIEVSVQESGVRSQDSEVRARLGIPEDAFVIGSVGRLAHVKGYDRLITAFAAIYRLQTTDIRHQTSDRRQEEANASRSEVYGLKSVVFLLLVGDGPERANLERLARELGVASRVVFAGFQKDPMPYLGAMDLFVLPSRSEGLSIALLEAMAAGVPVAVTDVGANREVVEDGRCGVILQEDDQQWPEALSGILTNPAGCREMSLDAKQRVERHYSMEATLDGYERVYAAK